MSEERELLRRALEAYDHKEEPYFERLHHAFEDIRAFLAAEPEAEPIGYVTQYSDGILGSDIYYTPEEAVDYAEGGGIGIPVYRDPPKSVARPIGYADRHELEEFKSGNYGNFSVQCKEKCEDAVAVFIEPAARKPIDHQIVLEKAISLKFRTPDPMSAFFSGVNFAEKHHGITE